MLQSILAGAVLAASVVSGQAVGGSGPLPPVVATPAATGSWRPPASSGGGKPASLTGMGRTAYINSANDFCLFLPPDPTKSNLVEAEVEAVAYCTNPSASGLSDTRPMPDGFLLTSHFRKTADYVQISGTYNPAVMNLASNDCGGEYDNHGPNGVGNPPGASYQNGSDWMQFLGACDIPGSPIFCVRSCHGSNAYPNLCPNFYDLMGCLFTMPGQYTEPGFDNCEATDTHQVGLLANGNYFRQGDASTPLPDAFAPAPASSNCKSVSSPSASGVTYTWNQAAATAAPSIDSNAGNSPTSVSGANNAATSSSSASANSGSASASTGAGGRSAAAGTQAPIAWHFQFLCAGASAALTFAFFALG